jgi:hypothetical protein
VEIQNLCRNCHKCPFYDLEKRGTLDITHRILRDIGIKLFKINTAGTVPENRDEWEPCYQFSPLVGFRALRNRCFSGGWQWNATPSGIWHYINIWCYINFLTFRRNVLPHLLHWKWKRYGDTTSLISLTFSAQSGLPYSTSPTPPPPNQTCVSTLHMLASPRFNHTEEDNCNTCRSFGNLHFSTQFINESRFYVSLYMLLFVRITW